MLSWQHKVSQHFLLAFLETLHQLVATTAPIAAALSFLSNKMYTHSIEDFIVQIHMLPWRSMWIETNMPGTITPQIKVLP
jgi:hypothetical protein